MLNTQPADRERELMMTTQAASLFVEEEGQRDVRQALLLWVPWLSVCADPGGAAQPTQPAVLYWFLAWALFLVFP